MFRRNIEKRKFSNFNATRLSRTFQSDFLPLKAKVLEQIQIPLLEAPFEEWLAAKFLALPKLLTILTFVTNSHQLMSADSAPDHKSPAPSTNIMSTRPNGRQTKRSRRFAERRLQHIYLSKSPPSTPSASNVYTQPEIVRGLDIMSTACKEKLLRRILNLPAALPIRECKPSISRLRHSAQSFDPTPAPRPPSHHLPAPCSSVLDASHTPSTTKDNSRGNHPIVSPTPSKMGGRLLFPPPCSPAKKSPSPSPLNSPPPPPLPSQFNTEGQSKNMNLPTFP